MPSSVFPEGYFAGRKKKTSLKLTAKAPETLGLEDAFLFWEGILTGAMLVLGSVRDYSPALSLNTPLTRP